MLQMLKRKRQKGFTLIELLIVVAIIGIIAALLIPNFLEALQKAKQKRTMADERNWGNAAFAWITDELGAAAAGQDTWQYSDWATLAATSADDVAAELVPAYMSEMPRLDGWKQAYVYALKTGNPLASNVAYIQSIGRDGTALTTGTRGPFDPTDYDNDIVWADGFFLQWPEKDTPASSS
jgi:prepilin-type N-terminal cleavage/methylation domain-containing protein